MPNSEHRSKWGFPARSFGTRLWVVPAIYTILAEGLASHGFIVAATNHPPDSLIAVFPDGHELKSQPYWPVDADRRTQGIAIGKFADDVLVPDVSFLFSTSWKR